MTTYTHKNSDFLTHISQNLMLHGSFADNPGLLTGKMDIVIFFYHYSRQVKDTLYGEFAGELLDEIYEDIHTGIPVGFASGLCGIACGILYLIENGFVDANPDEVLSDIDQAIMRYDVRKIIDTSFDTGLSGIAHYIFQRKNIDNLYLQELIENMKSCNLQITGSNSLLQKMLENIEIPDDVYKHGLSLLSIAPNEVARIGLKLIFEGK